MANPEKDEWREEKGVQDKVLYLHNYIATSKKEVSEREREESKFSRAS